MNKILKNNEAINIRAISKADAFRRHNFFVELSLAQKGMLHTIDEIDFHVSESSDKIDDFFNNQRGLWLIALNSDEEVVGEIDIYIKNLERVRHVGQLTIGVLPSYQGLGLGSLLMEEALLWAQKIGLLRIELSVFNSNKNAQYLYKKYNFIVEGVKKNFLRHADGTFEDDIMMACVIKK